MEQLFLESKLSFDKLAAGTTMPDDPNQWPQAITQELFKQVPYISDFTPHVTMQKSDGERGYGMGFIIVSSQSEMQALAPAADQGAAGVRQVRIPVIIRENKLLPLDILITDDAKILPLTESRLRAAMFRPQAFDMTGKTPGDQSMIGQLYPPFRQNYGMGGGVAMPGDAMGKTSSALVEYLEKAASLPEDDNGAESPAQGEGTVAKGMMPGTEGYHSDQMRAALKEKSPGPMKAKESSVLEAVLPTANVSDLDTFRETLLDPDVRLAYEKNAAATVGAVSMVLNHKPGEKLASPLELVSPTVIQVLRLDEGYRVKSASHRAWEPKVFFLDRGTAMQKLGSKVVLAADTTGAATIAAGADAGEPPEAPVAAAAAAVEEPGMYKVQKDDGEELVGVVVPSLIDIDGSEVPISLFTNGSQAAVQTDILGTPVGGDAELPTGEAPQGYGVFFTSEGGTLRATIPLTLHSSTSGPDPAEPPVFQGETYDGNPVEVSVQPNIQTVVGSPDGRMLVPAHWQWSPLNQAGDVSLASSEPEVNKQAAAIRHFASVQIRSGGETFSISGPAVEKLASAEKEFINLDDAMFLLAGLGVEQGYGMRKLAEASTGFHPVQVRIGRFLTTAEEQKTAAAKTASARLQRLPVLRRQLFKEAAVITDPAAVDTVLSLGFINPENITAFVNYIPELNDAQNKLCELLLASRLGLSDVPEGALEKSVRATEEVIEGLKTIAFQGPAEYS
jgi:hypothetical protein